MRRGMARMSIAAAAASVASLASVVAVGPALPAQAATGYRVTVTCTVPKSQPERQLAPNSCLNYVPDGTQTYTAKVRNSSGSPVAGVTVSWSDSDAQDALFRINQNPCVTGSSGSCSAELVDRHPKAGEKITVTASVKGASGTGYLTFKR
ncbi:hypothetical protein GCM10009740_06650 [Terrabacter terrae]|uniref:Big-1 domain-containing protein n=1 Tax=Terrabacter terrae TaxID=318434 RepID=A0ABN2TUQ0_9MICO